MTHGLGRVFRPDERDKLYPMGLLLPAAVKRDARFWPFRGPVLDQGPQGTCVGHGWEHWLRTGPIETKMSHADAISIYKASRTIDGEDPEDMDSGSSVRGGAKAICNRGQLKSYLWGYTVNDVVDWITEMGPVVLGVNWYDSFNTPDEHGLIGIGSHSRVIGGHCFMARGADRKRGKITALNSWGEGWSDRGHFSFTFETLEQLLEEDGDACAASQTKVVKQ